MLFIFNYSNNYINLLTLLNELILTIYNELRHVQLYLLMQKIWFEVFTII